MSQTIGRDEEVGFLSSLGVLCLAADGRWAVKRPGTNGLDGPRATGVRLSLASLASPGGLVCWSECSCLACVRRKREKANRR